MEIQNISNNITNVYYKDLSIYQGTYCLAGVDEFAARFIDNVFLSIRSNGDKLVVSDETRTGEIAFEKFEIVNGIQSAIFSEGYVFELNENNQPINVRRGNTCWTFWGRANEPPPIERSGAIRL